MITRDDKRAFFMGRAQVVEGCRAHLAWRLRSGTGTKRARRARGEGGARGRARPVVPRRAPLGPAARLFRPHERAGVLAQRARVWYARASPLWPLCWRPWRCWLCCPVSVSPRDTTQQASAAPPRLFTLRGSIGDGESWGVVCDTRELPGRQLTEVTGKVALRN